MFNNARAGISVGSERIPQPDRNARNEIIDLAVRELAEFFPVVKQRSSKKLR